MDFHQCNIPREQSKAEEMPQNHLSAKKAFDKILLFHGEKTTQLEAEGNYLNIIKSIYEKSTTNTIVNCEQLLFL